MQTFLLEMVWLGRARSVEVIALEGNALFGTGLMLGSQITIDAIWDGEVITEAL